MNNCWRQIFMLILLCLLSTSMMGYAKTVKGYHRKDGTYVSGYTTGTKSSSSGFAEFGGVLVIAVILLGIGCYGFIKKYEENDHQKNDKNLATRRIQDGVFAQQIKRAQQTRPDPSSMDTEVKRGLERARQNVRTGSSKRHPFSSSTLHPESWLHRRPVQNAFVELNNALAMSDSVQNVSLDQIAQFNAKYKTDLHKTSKQQMEVMYKEFIAYCLADKQFSQEEANDILHLKKLFGISDVAHNRIYDEVCSAVYRKSVQDAIADGQVTDDEKAFLDKLSADLELSEKIKSSIYKEEAGGMVQRKFQAVTASGQLSPDEENQIYELGKRLRIDVNIQHSAQLDKYRKMWQIVHGDLPVVGVDIKLQKGEVCFATAQVNWHEMRRVTKRVQYAGPQMRIKICKGVYWKMGDMAINPISRDQLVKIDAGTAYITNKRVLFRGSSKNVTINLSKIIDFTPYRDGVMVEKETGRSPYLLFDEEVDIFTACLARIIQDAG